MIWFCVIIFSLLIGIAIGSFIMYYKDRNLIKNQKILYDELKNNKIKLKEYQERLSSHFACNIELLNNIAENYRNLYQNIMKNANFFLPNTYTKNNTCSSHVHNEYKKNDEFLPVEMPKDYSENSKILQKDTNDLN